MPTTLGELAKRGELEFSDGYRTRGSEYAPSGFRIIRAGDVNGSSINFSGPDFVSSTRHHAIGAKTVREGDVILTTKGTVGRTARVRSVPESAVYSPQLCYFRPTAERLDPGYLFHWFSSPEFIHQSTSMKSSTDMAPYISLSQLAETQISIPALPEQQAIAEVLGALDNKIAANRALVATSEALLRARYLHEILDPEAAETPIAEILDFNPKRKISTTEAPQIAMQDLPTPCMVIPKTSYAEPNGGVRFTNGDTLLARITPCLENGKTGYVSNLADKEVAFGSTEYIVLRSKDSFPLPLSYFIATEESFRTEAIQRMVGSSGRQRLKADDLADFTINITRDATALAAFGESAIAAIEHATSITNESATLASLRDTLLPALMDGTIRVKDAITEAEEVL